MSYLLNFTKLIESGNNILSVLLNKKLYSEAVLVGYFLDEYINTISPILKNINNLVATAVDSNGNINTQINERNQMIIDALISDVYYKLSYCMNQSDDKVLNYRQIYDFAFKALSFRLNEPGRIDELRKIQDECIIPICKRYTSPNVGDLRDFKTRSAESGSVGASSDKTRGDKEIIVTMTSCKRFDLFQETVDSFFNCCLDKDKISEWIVVDDNSSEEDRKKMKEKYPFIKFIFKSIEEKGHPRSMNIIRDYVINGGYKYQFNLEDDMRFFVKDNFMGKCISVLEANPQFGQCLLNRNYSEESEGHNIVGGKMGFTNTEHIRYYIHEYYTGKELERFMRENPGKGTVAYWPHYSFRVGMTKVEALKDIGRYNENDSHFEREYAYRYVDRGYITTFLDSTFCQHSGRKTWERHDNKVQNAYQLNGESQFSRDSKNVNSQLQTVHEKKESEQVKEKTQIEKTQIENSDQTKLLMSLVKLIYDAIDIKSGKKSSDIQTSFPSDLREFVLKSLPSETKTVEIRKEVNQIIQTKNEVNQKEEIKRDLAQTKEIKKDSLDFKTYLINLKRRPDRLDKFQKENASKLGPIKPHIFEAIDGEKLNPNNQILKLFETNDFDFKRGVMGCACSHIKIWLELIHSNVDFALVLEDDAELCDGFSDKFIELIKKLPYDNQGNVNWDLVYLGYHKYDNSRGRSEEKPVEIKLFSKQETLKQNMGGTFGYIISKRGAGNILEHIQENGVYNGIDWLMFKTSQADSGIGNTESIMGLLPGKNFIYYCDPELIFSDVANTNNPNLKVDSDIQYNPNSLYLPLKDRLENEIIYWSKEYETSTGKNSGSNYRSLIAPTYKGNLEIKLNRVKYSENSRINLTDKIPHRTKLLTEITIIKFNDIKSRNEMIRTVKLYPLVYYNLEENKVVKGHKTHYQILETNGYLVIVPETRLDGNVLNEITFEGYINNTFNSSC